MAPASRERTPTKPKLLRVVLDTNAVLSALVFKGGVTSRLRRAWQHGEFQPLVSRDTAAELLRVLNYPKFRLSEPEQQQLLADYLPFTRSVRVADPPPAVPPCRDDADLMFLHLARAGHATILVTGDRALLEIGRVGSCAIQTPDAFLASGLLPRELTQT